MNRIYGRLMRIGVLGLDFRIGGVGILEGMVRGFGGTGYAFAGAAGWGWDRGARVIRFGNWDMRF